MVYKSVEFDFRRNRIIDFIELGAIKIAIEFFISNIIHLLIY